MDNSQWIPCNIRLPKKSAWCLVKKEFLFGNETEISTLWYGDIGNGNHFYSEESPKRENIPLGQRILEFDFLVIAWQYKN